MIKSIQDARNVKEIMKPYLNVKNMKKISVDVYIVRINMSMNIYQDT